MTERITSFSGEYAFLSNFWKEWDGKTVEHFFQACKTDDDEEQYFIIGAATPGEAKRLGRKATLRPDWEEIKDNDMYVLVKDKFGNPELKAKLLATGDAELVEGNTWGDTYWGVCRGVGQNKLGQILMRVREELRDGESNSV